MAGPAQAGISIYANDKEHLACFYETILGMSRLYESAEATVLQSPHIQLVIHRIPSNRASSIVITTPPQRRDSALKFFFTVTSITETRSLSQKLGGDVALEQWRGPGFIVSDANDPEGNVFHLRENAA